MNWDAIGAAGEWAGAIVVIATLFYLARQIRENSITNRIAGINSIADSARDIHFMIASNEDMARLFKQGTENPTGLNENDRTRFEHLLWGILRQIEAFYVQHQNGILDEPAMLSYAAWSVEQIHSNALVREHWIGSDDYNPAFRDWMDIQVKKAQSDSSRPVEPGFRCTTSSAMEVLVRMTAWGRSDTDCFTTPLRLLWRD